MKDFVKEEERRMRGWRGCIFLVVAGAKEVGQRARHSIGRMEQKVKVPFAEGGESVRSGIRHLSAQRDEMRRDEALEGGASKCVGKGA